MSDAQIIRIDPNGLWLLVTIVPQSSRVRGIFSWA